WKQFLPCYGHCVGFLWKVFELFYQFDLNLWIGRINKERMAVMMTVYRELGWRATIFGENEEGFYDRIGLGRKFLSVLGVYLIISLSVMIGLIYGRKERSHVLSLLEAETYIVTL
ncbi:hypothetical protein ERO13_D09G053460v2, partial [Gossypium hirsutum]